MAEQTNTLAHRSVERLAATIVAGMIQEAAYRGIALDAGEISRAIVADPQGMTASYFRRSVADSLDLIAIFRADADVLAAFPGGAQLAVTPDPVATGRWWSYARAL